MGHLLLTFIVDFRQKIDRFRERFVDEYVLIVIIRTAIKRCRWLLVQNSDIIERVNPYVLIVFFINCNFESDTTTIFDIVVTKNIILYPIRSNN
jgi:hypothetical protein